jgi:hypothetical protein
MLVPSQENHGGYERSRGRNGTRFSSVRVGVGASPPAMAIIEQAGAGPRRLRLLVCIPGLYAVVCGSGFSTFDRGPYWLGGAQLARCASFRCQAMIANSIPTMQWQQSKRPSNERRPLSRPETGSHMPPPRRGRSRRRSSHVANALKAYLDESYVPRGSPFPRTVGPGPAPASNSLKSFFKLVSSSMTGRSLWNGRSAQ